MTEVMKPIAGKRDPHPSGRPRTALAAKRCPYFNIDEEARTPRLRQRHMKDAIGFTVNLSKHEEGDD